MSRKLDFFGNLEHQKIAKIERYSFSLIADRVIDEMFVAESRIGITLRPQNIITNIKERGLVTITDFDIEGYGNQLAEEVDAYQFSFDNKQEIYNEFLREHNLVGASHDAIDNYLDEHELDIPDPTRAYLPTIEKGKNIIVAGIINKPIAYKFIVMLMGAAQVVE